MRYFGTQFFSFLVGRERCFFAKKYLGALTLFLVFLLFPYNSASAIYDYGESVGPWEVIGDTWRSRFANSVAIQNPGTNLGQQVKDAISAGNVVYSYSGGYKVATVSGDFGPSVACLDNYSNWGYLIQQVNNTLPFMDVSGQSRYCNATPSDGNMKEIKLYGLVGSSYVDNQHWGVAIMSTKQSFTDSNKTARGYVVYFFDQSTETFHIGDFYFFGKANTGAIPSVQFGQGYESAITTQTVAMATSSSLVSTTTATIVAGEEPLGMYMRLRSATTTSGTYAVDVDMQAVRNTAGTWNNPWDWGVLADGHYILYSSLFSLGCGWWEDCAIDSTAVTYIEIRDGALFSAVTAVQEHQTVMQETEVLELQGDPCSITQPIGCAKNVLRWLFYPPESSKVIWTNATGQLQEVFPFSVVQKIKEATEEATATTTSSQSLVVDTGAFGTVDILTATSVERFISEETQSLLRKIMEAGLWFALLIFVLRDVQKMITLRQQ